MVGTPGRILDHLDNTTNFKYNNLKCLILDEADKLLEAGFEKHLTGIMRKIPSEISSFLAFPLYPTHIARYTEATSQVN